LGSELWQAFFFLASAERVTYHDVMIRNAYVVLALLLLSSVPAWAGAG